MKRKCVVLYIIIEPKKPAKHAILLILLIKQAKIKPAG
jgi:hypothetical protein